MHKLKRRCVTLIEMMIVMFLIALIIGAVAYKYQGSLEEGKAFKTKVGMEKLATILTLIASNDSSFETDNWEKAVEQSPLVSNAKDLISDGWGDKYSVNLVDGEIKVTSTRYTDYLRKNPGTMFGDKK